MATIKSEQVSPHKLFAEKSPEFRQTVKQLVQIKKELADENLTAEQRSELTDLEIVLRGHGKIMADELSRHKTPATETPSGPVESPRKRRKVL